MTSTNPDSGNPQPEPNPAEPTDITPLTQEDLDKAVAATEVTHAEQIKGLEKQHQTDTNQLIATMNQQRDQQQNVPPAAVPGISDADFSKAIEDGEVGTVSKYFDQKLDANDKKWEEKLGQIQTYGMDAIGNLARQQASTSPAMPYYNEFKEDIDALLKQHNASDPVSIQNAYNLVVGQNVGKITQMEMEKKARQANPPDATTPGSGKPDRGSKKDTPFNVDDVISADAQKALQRRRDPITPDQLVQKMNRHMGLKFENFEAMHNKREELVQQDREYFDDK